MSPLEARRGLDLTPLAVSYLLQRIGPEFLLPGDLADPEETTAEDLATLPEEARAILAPTVRLDSKAGPWVEIINRRGAV